MSSPHALPIPLRLLAALHSEAGMDEEKNLRVLVVDDNEAIHNDFRKILGTNAAEAEFDAAEAAVFGRGAIVKPRLAFEMTFALQGAEALELVRAACQTGRRYSVVFMDVRMPPGWDGLETTAKLWEVDPDLQVVICTAYSDKSWEEMMERIPSPERLLILKKPFDAIEVLQMAHALTEKWSLLQSSRRNQEEMKRIVDIRTHDLRAANTHLESEIASHKATEAAYLRSEQRFANFFENASVGLLQIRADGTIDRVNKAQTDLLGYSKEQCEGHHISEFQADAEGGGDFLQRLLAGETVTDFEARLRCRDGTIKQVLIDANSLWEIDEFVHTRCFMRDNTARKQAEKELRQSEATMATAQRMTHFGSWELDLSDAENLNANPLRWSDETFRIFGYEPGSLPVTNELFFRAVPPEDHSVITTAVAAAIAGRNSCCFVHRVKRPNGEERIVQETAHFLAEESHGRAPKLIGTVLDITEKKNMEAQLLRSQRMESVGRLSSGIAHDLNNILTPILMCVFMLRRQLPEDESERALDTIETSTQRGADLIKQLLTFGRGTSGQRHPVQLKMLVRDMAKMVSETFPRNITLSSAIPGECWPVMGDATQLQQVLLNLCVNARDAMPQGGTLTLGTKNVVLEEKAAVMKLGAGTGPYVQLQVSDTGEGIPPEVIDKIFDPFFTTKSAGKGTGLGLSTVIGIVKSHHGFVNLRSSAGTGSTFEIYLPAASDSMESAVEAAPATAPPRGDGELILVVDDEAGIRKVVEQTLLAHGYRVLAASDGTEAISLYSGHKDEIKAVLTDIMMPSMDGVALIRVLKKVNSFVKVIASSGIGDSGGNEDKAAELSSLGVKSFLRKPFTAIEVLTALHDLLEES